MKRTKRMKTMMTELNFVFSLFSSSPPPLLTSFLTSTFKLRKRPTWLAVGSVDHVNVYVNIYVNIDHVLYCYLLMV